MKETTSNACDRLGDVAQGLRQSMTSPTVSGSNIPRAKSLSELFILTPTPGVGDDKDDDGGGSVVEPEGVAAGGVGPPLVIVVVRGGGGEVTGPGVGIATIVWPSQAAPIIAGLHMGNAKS